MKTFFRLLRLLWGLFLYALGIVVTMAAHIGYAPWEVFHVGLANTLGISVGLAAIGTGVVLGLIALMLGEKLGLGTILNMLLIGVFLDILLDFRLVPQAGNFAAGLAMMVAGLFIISLATFFYIGSAFGAGPRDSLMVALTKKTKLPVGVCRGAIELTAVLVGWRLGGMVGAGTVIYALAIGFSVQTTFRILNFKVALIRHESVDQTWAGIFNKKKDGI